MFAFCKILFWCGFVPKLLSTAFSRWSPCGSGSVCHLHIPRSHQQSPGHFSTLQKQSSDFPGNHSTWGKVFLGSAFFTSHELTEKFSNIKKSLQWLRMLPLVKIHWGKNLDVLPLWFIYVCLWTLKRQMHAKGSTSQSCFSFKVDVNKIPSTLSHNRKTKQVGWWLVCE